MRKQAFVTYLTVACAACAAMPVAAQSRQQARQGEDRQQADRFEGQQRSQQRSRQRAEQQRTGQQQQRAEQQQQRESQRRRGRSGNVDAYLVPEGWVTIGIDTDRDQQIDAWKTIYEFDLVTALERSQQRRGRQEQQSPQRGRQRDQTVQIEGTVRNMHKTKLKGHEEQFVCARVRTSSGRTAKVLLGTQKQLNKLDLQEGDRLTVTGQAGRINDRMMLIATKVQSGNKVVDMTPAGKGRFHDLRAIRGDIQNLHTRKFRGQNEPFKVAQIDVGQGPSRTIILGPASKVKQLDLQSGDQVSALVRKGSLNGETALVASEVYANGEAVDVERPATGRPDRQQSGERSASAQSGRQ